MYNDWDKCKSDLDGPVFFIQYFTILVWDKYTGTLSESLHLLH